MKSTTTRRLGGVAVIAAVILTASAPVLAATGSPRAAGNHPVPDAGRRRPAAPSSAVGAVRIGTAAQWVRGPDGTIHRVR